MQPLISVLINCYNSEKFIKTAIQSVLNQSYNNFEIIIWDNRSNDCTKEIISSFRDNRIKYYLSKKHTNLSQARHNAIMRSSGNWFIFLDSDDFWEIDILSEQIKIILNDKRIGLIFCKAKIFNKEKNDTKWSKSFNNRNIKIDSNDSLFDLLLKKNFIYISSVLFNKNYYGNKLNINPKLNFAEDYDILLKYSQKYKFRFIDKYLLNYRIHNNNLSIKHEKDNIKEILLIFKSLLPNKKVNRAIYYQLTLHLIIYVKNLRFDLLLNLLKHNFNPLTYLIGFYYVINKKI